MIKPIIFCLIMFVKSVSVTNIYDATISGREILTPTAPAEPRITSPALFGVTPGKPVFFRVSSTGERSFRFEAEGLPEGISIESKTGWITGRAPYKTGDITIHLKVSNSKGKTEQYLILRVGNKICLTPPMGWNSWYVLAMSISDKSIRETALAMRQKGLDQYGYTYVNLDDCWSGERNKKTGAIQANSKFGDMKELVQYVNNQGFKLGIYSTPWMSTYCGFIGGSAPNDQYDYSKMYLPKNEQEVPGQFFGRHPKPMQAGRTVIGEVWLVDRDAKQFADWGIDFVKYDWKEWTMVKTENGYSPSEDYSEDKTEGVTKRFFEDFQKLDRDIVISLSPRHSQHEDTFVPKYCNMWRLTHDILRSWENLMAPFEEPLSSRLQLTSSGCYGDLDMLQIGPVGIPNDNNVTFKPCPFTPSEQYFQVSLWCLLTQPLLLSCHIPSMDAFDLNLVCNAEVLAVNQDILSKQAYRVINEPSSFEIWAKDLADGSKAVGLFNLSDNEQILTLNAKQLKASGKIRDLWRQRDIGRLEDSFSAKISPHGVLLVRIEQ